MKFFLGLNESSSKDRQEEEQKENLWVRFKSVVKNKWTKKRYRYSVYTIASLLGTTFIITNFIYVYLFLLTGNEWWFKPFDPYPLIDDAGRPLDFDKIVKDEPLKASYVLADDGSRADTFFWEIRDPVKYEEIQPLFIRAFIAAEDQEYFEHNAIDWSALIRAITRFMLLKFPIPYFDKLAGYLPNSGASTISQQYAKTAYADDIKMFREREYSARRKIVEMRLAVQVDKRHSKEKILEALLNKIYLGMGNFGIAEATRYYFGKDIRKKNLALREIAVLVSLNKSASVYYPTFRTNKPELSEGLRLIKVMDRCNYVLGRTLDDGYINQEQYDEARFDINIADVAEKEARDKIAELTSIIKKEQKRDNEARYFSRTIKELLLVGGYDDFAITHTGGFTIHSSLRPRYQKVLAESISGHIERLNGYKNENEEKLQGYGVILDIATGRILALSGGSDYGKTQYNRVFARRSGGSAMKPFTYAAAIEYAGMDFYDPISNTSFRMPNLQSNSGRILEWWSPKNFQERNPVPMGNIALYQGLVRSVNLATLQLARHIGLENVFKLYERVGLWGRANMVMSPNGKVVFSRRKTNGKDIKMGLEPYLPTVIGGSDVNLLELASAFGVFARGGKYIPPSAIIEVMDSEGKSMYKTPYSKPEQVILPETADKITVMLRAVTKIGTAKITFRDSRQEVACKTGTSDGPNDLLLVCFTPEIIIAVRVGYDIPRPIKLPEYMLEVSGDDKMYESAGWVVGPMMRLIVDRIYEGHEPVLFSENTEEELLSLLELHKISPNRGYIGYRPENILQTEDEASSPDGVLPSQENDDKIMIEGPISPRP